MAIYTGAGDNGTSSTAKEKNISKASPVFEALGSLDECSAALGLAKSYTEDKMLSDDITLIQNKLIEVCGELAGGACAVSADCTLAVEKMIDRYSAQTGGFDGFTVSGINCAEASINLARCAVRRAERAAAAFDVTLEMRKYINRLSDLLYVMAQYAAHR